MTDHVSGDRPGAGRRVNVGYRGRYRRNAWLPEEDERLIRLWKAGATTIEMAAEIGRPETQCNNRVHALRQMGLITGSKPKPAPQPSKMRRCLMCAQPFRSSGPGNRVCGSCKLTDAWRGGPEMAVVL